MQALWLAALAASVNCVLEWEVSSSGGHRATVTGSHLSSAADKLCRSRSAYATSSPVNVTSQVHSIKNTVFTYVVCMCGQIIGVILHRMIDRPTYKVLTQCLQTKCTPLPSYGRNRSNDYEGKSENCQVCSVQYCVQHLYTVQCTHIWTDLAVVCWLDLAFLWLYCVL